MVLETQEMTTRRITAIALERTRKAWSDEPYTIIPVAWVMVDEDEGIEERIDITRAEYDALREIATDTDAIAHQEGDYISFEKPIEWADVLPGDRGQL